MTHAHPESHLCAHPRTCICACAVARARSPRRNLRRGYESLSRFEYKEALREMVDRHKESVMMLDSEWSPQLPPTVFEELRALRTRF